MKRFFEFIEKDILSEEFTTKEYVVYGIIAPIALIVLMGIAGWIDSLV